MKSRLYYLFAVFALVLCVQGCGEEDPINKSFDNGEYGKIAPGEYVATGDYTDLSVFSAKMLCSINSELIGENLPICTCGVVLSTDKAKLKDFGRQLQFMKIVGNCYEVVAVNLFPDTEYFYCGYLSMAGGPTWWASEIKSFKTKNLSLATGDVSEVSAYGCSIDFSIDAEQFKAVETIGMFISKDKNPSIENYVKDLPVSKIGEDGHCTVKVTGLDFSTEYHYCAYAIMSIEGNIRYCYGTERQFTTKDVLISDSDAVDLDLPSGLKWASCNLGASSPEKYGNYYAWGEVEPKSEYSSNTGKWENVSYSDLRLQGVIDDKGNLTAEYDVATVKLGEKWRMPTFDEIEELLNNCTWSWGEYKGTKGYAVFGKNGKTIFLPAAGFRFDTDLYEVGYDGTYWSSTVYNDGADAYYLYFNSHRPVWYYNYRYDGYIVRPVSE